MENYRAGGFRFIELDNEGEWKWNPSAERLCSYGKATFTGPKSNEKPKRMLRLVTARKSLLLKSTVEAAWLKVGCCVMSQVEAKVYRPSRKFIVLLRDKWNTHSND